MEDITEQIKSCLGQHPAIRIPFDELYAGIMAEVNAGFINRQVKDDLELFDYSRSCTLEGHWNPFTIVSRGLILCPTKKQVICLGILKFWNYGETLYLPENEEFRATTKYDGSCAFLWNYQDSWHCSTRGSFYSDQAMWAED